MASFDVNVLILGDSIVEGLAELFYKERSIRAAVQVVAFPNETSESIAQNPHALPHILMQDAYDICILVVGTHDVDALPTDSKNDVEKTALSLSKLWNDCFFLKQRGFMTRVVACTVPGADEFNERLKRRCAVPIIELCMTEGNAHEWQCSHQQHHLSEMGKRRMVRTLMYRIQCIMGQFEML